MGPTKQEKNKFKLCCHRNQSTLLLYVTAYTDWGFSIILSMKPVPKSKALAGDFFYFLAIFSTIR